MDKEYTLQELESFVERINKDFFLNELWEIREAYLALPEETLKTSVCVYAVAFIYALKGDFDKMEKVIAGSTVHGLRVFRALMMCTTTPEEFSATVKELYLAGKNLKNFLTISAGRPSIINGYRDFTFYNDVILHMPDLMKKVLSVLYVDNVSSLYNLLKAEVLYQRNECLEAMVLVVGEIPLLDQNYDARSYFVALYIQMSILLVNGQLDSAERFVHSMRERISSANCKEFTDNIDALEANVAIYEGNYAQVSAWLENKAPDENGELNLFDLYRYMVKLRCYLLTGKTYALMTLSSKLRPYLEKMNRTMDLCELNMLDAMAAYKAEAYADAFSYLEKVLHSAKKNRFDRLLGNQGLVMLQLLRAYKKENPKSEYGEYADRIIEIARKISLLYPDYLIMPFTKTVTLTEIEKGILQLLNQGKSYDEIADIYFVSANTVRFHIKKIYTKLEVHSAHEAIYRSKKLGIL